MPGRPHRAVLVGAAWSVAAAPALTAQTRGTLEGAVSRVQYDDFLPSGAASLGTTLSVQGRRATLSARGSYLLFESGNSTWQAALAGSVLTERVGPSRPEFWVATGGSRYASAPSFWHAILGARCHFGINRGTAWLDGSVGRTSFGAGHRPITMIGAGLWTRRYGPAVTLGATYVRVGDTTYADLQGTARAQRRSVELDGVLGARIWSNGGGRGVYAEATVAVPLGRSASLVLAGGRYPTDPWRGTVSGNYVSAGVRFRTLAPGPRAAPPTTPGPVLAASDASAADGRASLELAFEADGIVRFVIRAPGAASVDVAGDFTDWEPLALARAGLGLWETAVRLAPGVHRLNVRFDGGPWFVPSGATRTGDDFGGEIGTFVVP